MIRFPLILILTTFLGACSSGKNLWSPEEVDRFESNCMGRFEEQRIGDIYYSTEEAEDLCDCLSTKMSERAAFSAWQKDPMRYLEDMRSDGTLHACLYDAASLPADIGPMLHWAGDEILLSSSVD